MTKTRVALWLLFLTLASPAGRAGATPPLDRDQEMALALEAGLPGGTKFYAPNMSSKDRSSDGTSTSPLLVVDEKTPHASMIVPAGSAGHAGGGK